MLVFYDYFYSEKQPLFRSSRHLFFKIKKCYIDSVRYSFDSNTQSTFRADRVSYLFQAVRHMRAYILLNNVVSLLIRLRKVKKYHLEYCEGFIVRITRNDVLNRIYGERTYFVELRRDWSKGMKLIFMKKTHDIDYCFIGSGIIDRVIDPNEFSSLEKILCAKNNCYRKIIFGRLARFYPSINLKQSKSGAWRSLALLHGMHLGASDIATIENLAVVSIVS